MVLAFLILVTGCESFLDKEPLDIISDALVWEDENLIDSFLADLYYRTDFMERKGNDECVSLSMIASMGGEGRSYGAVISHILPQQLLLPPPGQILSWTAGIIKTSEIVTSSLKR